MRIPLRPRTRRAVAGVIAALFLFLMIFTAGVGYLLFQNQSSLQKYQADANNIASRGLTNLERLSLLPTLKGSNIVVEINNTGGAISTVEAAYVKDGGGRMVSQIMILGPSGATNGSTPLTLAIAEHTRLLLNKYNYSGSPVFVNVLTQKGNIFSARYPLSVSGNSSTISTTVTTTTTMHVGAIGNPLVIVMIATPSQVFGGGTITLNITFYNFAATSLSALALNPSAPLFFVTGTATLTFMSPCSGPSVATIPGYSGVGKPPGAYFLCTYKAHPGTLGGIASFGGGGQAFYNGSTIQAAFASSNIVQVGGLTNALLYGAFSINFFLFKFTSCTNAPALNGTALNSIFSRYPTGYGSRCTTRSPMPPANWANLPRAANVSASNNYYVAFYLQLTNNFNSTLTLMHYTMMQLDQSDGYESDWWLAGNYSSSHVTNGVYYPNYNPGGNNIPTLMAYPKNCNQASPPSGCIAIGPGQSQVITLAACTYDSGGWDWGGVPNGDHFDTYAQDHHGGCISSWPFFGNAYGRGSAAVATLVISFFYKGHIFTQNIAFEGAAVLP